MRARADEVHSREIVQMQSGEVCVRMCVLCTHIHRPIQFNVLGGIERKRMYKVSEADTLGAMAWNAKGKHSRFMIVAVLSER